MVELLRTKLFIPRPRKNLVSRPRLVDCLNSGLDRKLTLIAAPAGFGKTTLLSEWIPQSPRCAIWLSLDDNDNDPSQFWTYFIKSLQGLKTELGEGAFSLLHSPQTFPINSILTGLINDVASFPDGFAIVLDDYHVIESQAVHEALAFLIDHQPANMHLMITTRIDPPLLLTRLRARDQLIELRANDLRFSVEETSEFLNQAMGLSLSIDEVAALETRTEGWIAGLQIAALSMQGREDVSGFVRNFSGSHRHILGYLAEEVINQQPNDILDFLLQTSILDRLCGPLCDAVTGDSGGQEILENLEHANLFVTSLDDDGRWYRYHHLFAEVLQARLRATQPGRLPELHQRASQWLAESGQSSEAIDHAISGKDYQSAVRLLAGIIQAYNDRGAIVALVNWFDQVPEEWVFENPYVFSYKGWLLYLSGRLDQAKKHANKAWTYITPDTPPVARGRLAFLASQLAIAEGDPSAVEEFALEALELIGEEDLFFRVLSLMAIAGAQTLSGNTKDAIGYLREAAQIGENSGQPFPTLTAYARLANQLNLQGSLREAQAVCQHAMRLYLDPSGQPSPICSISFVEAAKLAYEENEMGALEEYLLVATRLQEVISIPGLSFETRYIQTLLEGAKGNLDTALDLAGKGRVEAEQMGLKGYTAIFAALVADLLFKLENFAALERWMASAEVTFERCDVLLNMYGSIVYVRYLLQQDELSVAAMLITRMETAARQSGYARLLLTLLLLKALLYRQMGDVEPTQANLEEALRLAIPQGYLRAFIDEGEPLRLLLIDYQSINKQRPGALEHDEKIQTLTFLDRLLSAFSSDTNFGLSKNEKFPEPISERELDILRLIADGHSNQEIADMLVIAVSTVKSHINNLYGKLGTNRRTEAIAIARQRGLVGD
jgi:LuxR family transcriptional regulator, maltose regulon positive regulatory protein